MILSISNSIPKVETSTIVTSAVAAAVTTVAVFALGTLAAALVAVVSLAILAVKSVHSSYNFKFDLTEPQIARAPAKPKTGPVILVTHPDGSVYKLEGGKPLLIGVNKFAYETELEAYLAALDAQ